MFVKGAPGVDKKNVLGHDELIISLQDNVDKIILLKFDICWVLNWTLTPIIFKS